MQTEECTAPKIFSNQEYSLSDAKTPDARPLSEVLDALTEMETGDAVSIEAVVKALGRRSFPTLVLVPSLIAVSPASAIPGFTTTVGLIVGLITAQMLWGRTSAWLPDFITRQSITKTRLHRTLNWLRRPVARIERFAKPRLVVIVSRPLVAVPLATMFAISLTMPLMELIPMSGTIAGTILTTFAVGLLVRDGALVLIALAMSAVAPLAVWQLAT